jgi:hypothetical protein
VSLDKNALKTTIQGIFEDLGTTKTAAQAAQELADAIDDYVTEAVATVTVPTGTFLVAAQAGVPNPTPVQLVGDPDASTGGLS